MNVSDLGESGLIDLIRDWTSAGNPRVLLGPGDDAAILASSGEHETVVSTDAFREGVHFSREYLTPDEIGHRAMAAALSDLAAMGADGVAAFVDLFAPADTAIDFLRSLYQGMDRIADACGVTIAGGDTVRGPLALGITVIGSVLPGAAIRRDGAREGDVICVSGELGKSEAGRLLLSREYSRDMAADVRAPAESAHRMPRPRFDVSRRLMKLKRRSVDVELRGETVEPVRPTALIDVSDGLALDLHRICDASHVGCRLEERMIPLSAAAGQIARVTGRRETQLALAGGEDFELLFTMRPADVEILLEDARKASLRVTPIGEITHFKAGCILVGNDTNRTEEELPRAGFDHFRGVPDVGVEADSP
jgi:thiamine-monophosphate kinase